MPEIMPDDSHLLNVVQGLVVVLPLLADHLAGKGQFFFRLLALYDLGSAV